MMHYPTSLRRPGLSFLGVVLGIACATSPAFGAKWEMEPVVTDGSHGLGQLGIASKHDAHSVVAVRSEAELARRKPSEFSVMVVNLAGGPVPFSLSAISASQDGKALNVLDEEELAQQIERKRSRRQLFGALATAVGAVADVRATDVIGVTDAYFTTEVLSMVEEWSQHSDQILDQALMQYSQSALVPSTVLPKEKHGGSFMVEGIKRSGGPIDIDVSVGDQTHKLRFQPVRR